ncbi:MAG: hypothetical protein GQ581_07095 [Methyloprofundus sp.]|nr:hypothetical protein [Methyloprofundus sp.]
MGLFDSISSKAKVKTANKKVLAARAATDAAQADKLFAEAIAVYGSIASDNAAFKDALYNWGVTLLHMARLKAGAEAIAMYEDAGKRFSYCLVAKEDYLAAALDWSAALMELAPLQDESEREATYALAKEKMTIANGIQEGVASYNLACLHAVHGDFDACKESLEAALAYGNLPEEDDIINDADMQVAKTQVWFDGFIASINAPEESEKDDDSGDEDEEDFEYSKNKLRKSKYQAEYD